MAIWPLVLYLALVLVVIGGMLGLSYLLGQRHRERETGTPYESGVHPTGGARLRVDVQFYRVAVFFVVFDLEAVFLFAWAIAGRELGWSGYVELLVFVAVLVASNVVRAIGGPGDEGVSFACHIGGFVAGAVLVVLARVRGTDLRRDVAA